MYIYFFIRAYNDIDHLTPIAYKLLAQESVDSIVFVNYDLLNTHRDDFRINHLRPSGKFNYLDLGELSNKKDLIIKLNKLRPYASKLRLTSAIMNWLFIKLRDHIFSTFNFNNVTKERCDNVIFLFDHSNSDFLRNAFDYTRRNNIPLGLLMHGLDPTGNLMMSVDDYKVKKMGIALELFNKADVFFVNNEFYKYRNIQYGVDPNIIDVVGSARFAYEWSEQLASIVPSLDMPEIDDRYIRVVLMLAKWKYNNWKDETIRIIKTLVNIDDVYLVVKPHTRGMSFPDMENRKNLFIADNNMDSRCLIEWSDVVLFSISSIFLDAVLLDKPVLHLRCTTSNKMECADIMGNWNIDCRDDLIEWMDKFRKDRKTRSYSEEARRECLNLYVNDSDGRLLDRYAERILSLGDMKG